MAMQVGQAAPDFKAVAVVNKEFKEIKLSDYKGKWLVLFFYPMDFTFVCPTELTAFSDAQPKFKELGCELLGASTDTEFSHLAWENQPRNKGGLGDINYPILADKTKKVARDYGVLIEDAGIALRGLFLIDPKGVLQAQVVNNLPVGRSVEETLRLVEAFQYSEKHGEVCPANWHKGSKTIKPSSSQEYFSTLK